jgi:predicted RNA binding protein YcfA (HicA-like mRNA interferase family)
VSIKGSHVKFINTSASGTKVVIVPKLREIATGTLRSIVRQMGISQELFEEL